MYREWKTIEFPPKLYINLETTRLRGRPRNRWQDEVREDGMEEAPENGKESSHSAHGNGMNGIFIHLYIYNIYVYIFNGYDSPPHSQASALE